MPRIIFKCPYIKPGVSGSYAANLVEYIATRDGVDFVTGANRDLPATKKQTDLIGKILQDIPSVKNLFEFEDYERRPTIENASEFITQALEQNLHEAGERDYYVKYIAERPRVEKSCSHGLFTDAAETVVISQVQREVSEHTGNIWMPIISLCREDAMRLSYDSGRQWQALLRSQAAEIASHMKIQPDNFRWYAAFHNEAHHPHLHMVCWSANPREGYLTEQGIRDIKSGLARQIFRHDLTQIYEQQTDRRGKLNAQSLETMREMCERIKNGVCENPELDTLILRLSERLSNTGGKKVYGFLKPDVKAIVDGIVDELAKDTRVAACYSAWYEMREEVLRTYHDELPPRAPLSSQKEFKQIKNMVIAETLNFDDPVFSDRSTREVLSNEAATQSVDFDSVIIEEVPIPDPEPTSGTNANIHIRWTSEYKQARAHLFGSVTEKPDFEKAFELFAQKAESGSVLAMYANGLGREVDNAAAQEWYAQALAGFLRIESGMAPDDRKATYMRYRIGKMYMSGLGTEQDYSKAVAWLCGAAVSGHKYAQYSLGALYYRGLGVDQDYEAAFGLYSKSATQGNAYANYELAKMYRDGVGVEPNAEEAEYYFELSAELGNPYAQYVLAKLHISGEDVPKDIQKAIYWLTESANHGNQFAQYQLGKMYIMGKDVPHDRDQALHWFTIAAEQGNKHAQFFIDHIDEIGARSPDLFMAATRILRELGKTFEQQHQQIAGQVMQIDRKRMKILKEKKIAGGHASDDHEPKQSGGG